MINNITWKEFENKMKQVFGKGLFKVPDELYFNVTKQVDFGETTELLDIEALRYLQDLHDMNGVLYVITDLCYLEKYGPFVVNADEINMFVETFYATYHEAFYSTDIIIVNFDEKLIWVLFHEGICWLSESG